MQEARLQHCLKKGLTATRTHCAPVCPPGAISPCKSIGPSGINRCWADAATVSDVAVAPGKAKANTPNDKGCRIHSQVLHSSMETGLRTSGLRNKTNRTGNASHATIKQTDTKSVLLQGSHVGRVYTETASSCKSKQQKTPTAAQQYARDQTPGYVVGALEYVGRCICMHAERNFLTTVQMPGFMSTSVQSCGHG